MVPQEDMSPTHFFREEENTSQKKPRFIIDTNDLQQIKRGALTTRTNNEEKVSPKSILKNR